MKATKELQINGLADSKAREAIGAVCVHWSLLELMVERVIANLEGRPGQVRYTNDLAHRLKDMKRVAKSVLPPEQLKNLRNIAGDIKKLKDHRHHIVHGLWGLDEDGAPISLLPRTPSLVQLDPEYLRNVKRQIWKAHQDLRPFAGVSTSI